MNNDDASFASQITAVLVAAPNRELMKNNLAGEKRSDKVKTANINVPTTNPIITADVIRLTAY